MTQIRQFFCPQIAQIYAECGCTELRRVGTEFHNVLFNYTQYRETTKLVMDKTPSLPAGREGQG